MANEQNLIPFTSEQNREEAKKNGRKGGKASGKKRRQQKTFNELCTKFANEQITNEDLRETMKELGIKDEEMTNKMAMTISLYRQILKGNVKAFEIYRDTIGEQVIQKVQDVTPPKIIDDV